MMYTRSKFIVIIETESFIYIAASSCLENAIIKAFDSCSIILHYYTGIVHWQEVYNWESRIKLKSIFHSASSYSVHTTVLIPH